MRTTYTLLFLASLIIILQSCKKEDDPVPVAPVTPACGTPGLRLQATFNDVAWCPNSSLFASMSDILTISGMASNGSTLTLELDSLSPGTYQMRSEVNFILFTTEMGMAYQATDNAPATLVITEQDVNAQRIKGTFNGNLPPALGGAPRAINGSFDMFYVD